MEPKICGWPGCNDEVSEVNPRTLKKYYYCEPHRQRAKVFKKNGYIRNKDKHNSACLKRYHDLRDRVISMYGDQCQCCGETERVFLALDHVSGGGNEHRRKRGGSHGVYLDAANKYDPKRFQILCHNCNMAKQLLGHCPHSLVSIEE
jgi:hypothetical protein